MASSFMLATSGFGGAGFNNFTDSGGVGGQNATGHTSGGGQNGNSATNEDSFLNTSLNKGHAYMGQSSS
jgi:hypothetical protein